MTVQRKRPPHACAGAHRCDSTLGCAPNRSLRLQGLAKVGQWRTLAKSEWPVVLNSLDRHPHQFVRIKDPRTLRAAARRGRVGGAPSAEDAVSARLSDDPAGQSFAEAREELCVDREKNPHQHHRERAKIRRCPSSPFHGAQKNPGTKDREGKVHANPQSPRPLKTSSCGVLLRHDSSPVRQGQSGRSLQSLAAAFAALLHWRILSFRLASFPMFS
jgi:hypothetical protein